MWFHELREFNESLKLLKDFLSELASREDEIITFGLRRVAKWESYTNAIPVLEEFEVNILEVQDFAKAVDSEILEQFKRLVNDSSLIEELTTIYVQLGVLANKKALSASGDMVNTILFQIPYISGIFKHRRLFHKEQISIHKILVSITRLISLITRLEKAYTRKAHIDDEIFKPSNINNELLVEYLDASMAALESAEGIGPEDKERLLIYIESAKIEAGSSTPSWNKIVGALVIVATLLGGVAAAPVAYKNVTDAIQHILGVSIEKHMPNMLPPPKPEEPSNEEPETIVT